MFLQPLFEGQRFVVGHTLHTNPTKNEVTRLVVVGGGSVVRLKDIAQADFYLAPPGKPLPVGVPSHVKLVPQSEFFDAISNFTPLIPCQEGKVAAPAPQPASESTHHAEDGDKKCETHETSADDSDFLSEL